MDVRRFLGRGNNAIIVRFLLAGGSAAFLNWLMRFPLSTLLPYWLAVLVSTLIGMAYGFVVYRAYVFPRSQIATHKQVAFFVMVNLLTLSVTVGAAVLLKLFLINTVLEEAGAEAVAHGIGIGIGAVSNYFGHRHLTFGGNG